MSTTKKAKAAAKTRTSKTVRKGTQRTAKAAVKTTAKKRATAGKKTAAKSPRASAKKTVSARKKTPAKATPAAKSAAAKRSVAKKAAAKTAAAKKRTATTTAKTSRKRAGVTTGRPRRAIYIDVENTSSRAALLSVIDSLAIDRRQASVEMFAVGNWRAVGQQVARELAGLGAQLVHSAPARGVRDWSDLWIAVAAGSWIALAEPGDKLEIISNDRAFDAVGDAAAARGVEYERVPHRRSSATVTTTEPAADDKPKRRRRRRPRRAAKSAETTEPKEATAPPAEEDAHGASRDQMVELVERLSAGRSTPWVNLDVLEAALKREGFSRPPNSPRLVTRLRRLKDFEVDSHGRVRLLREGETASDDADD